MKNYLIILSIVLSSYSALSSAATDDQTAVNRLLQLSTIPTQASIDEAIALGSEGSTNKMRQQYVFTVLIRIGPSVSGDAYAKGILDLGTASAINLRGALAYLAEHPASWMNPYVAQYITASNDGLVRSMAAYLAGKLNMTDQKTNVNAVIADETIGNLRLYAALGLAQISSAVIFEPLITSSTLSASDKNLVIKYNQFLTMNDIDKAEKVKSLYRSSQTILAIAAFKYMLAEQKIALLKQLAIISEGDQGNAVVSNNQFKAMLRMLGYEVSGSFATPKVSTSALI
jgi:hypothetical protein